MDKVFKLDPIRPRSLRYRGHYKIYVMSLMTVSCFLMAFWCLRIMEDGFRVIVQSQMFELFFSIVFFLGTGLFYFTWLRPKLRRSVQVFSDHLLVHNGKTHETLNFSDIESLNTVCWSIFYLKMKDGIKYYFNSSLERVDYIWEGIYNARPDLISQKDFEEYRLKLVQYDHHQKRKEWFFKHKMVDVFNWIVLPLFFLLSAYLIQSKSVSIHREGIYFFRLFMFALLILLASAFFYSMILKKFVFDRKLEESEGVVDKVRDLEFEGMVLQRSKIFQLVTSCFVLAMVVKMDLNLYSISKIREDLVRFDLKKGHTIVVDNRFNCVSCKYQLNDGDLIVFGRGVIGQVLAKEGDMVGQVSEDTKGRSIASENVQVVPKGYLAVKASNGEDIMFVKIEDLIGKIQK